MEAPIIAAVVTPAVAADMVVQAAVHLLGVAAAEEVLEVILATAELGTVAAIVPVLVIVVPAAVEVEVDIIMVMVLVKVEVVV